jgi:anhydro-N-acetylmuramic acid kinase
MPDRIKSLPMTSRKRLIAGAMSGTSADGIDVAIVEIDGRGTDMTARLVRHHHRAYDTPLRQSLFALRSAGRSSFAELAHVGREISLTYAEGVNAALVAAGLKASDLAAVAAHGQTLFHEPPSTIQWFDPSLVAAATGCAVVSDFRRADCAAGGQGAPLVPFADYILFRHPQRNRVLLNVGGIANLTHVPADRPIDALLAFDTGPGNCISDWLCRELDPDGPGYDADGARALAAIDEADADVVARVLKGSAFFRQPPPKSTDIPSMIEAFRDAGMRANPRSDPRFADRARFLAFLLATAAHVTVRAIEDAIDRWAPRCDDLIVSGGGTRHAAILHLRRTGPAQRQAAQILRAHAPGVPADAKEAIAFSLLGAATLDNVPSNVPSCTGAKRRVILGSVTPKPV